MTLHLNGLDWRMNLIPPFWFGQEGNSEPPPAKETTWAAQNRQEKRRPAVSIIIPCRDDTHLFETLDSLAEQQDPPSFEVVVVDDTDHDLSIQLNSWHDRLQLRVLRSPTRGSPGANRNFGIAQAEAHLLLFVDADDTVGPTYIRAMVDALKSHELVCSRVEPSLLNPPGYQYHPQQSGLITAEMGFLPFAGTGTLGIRRSLYEEMNGFTTSLPCYEEADLCWRIQLAGHDPPHWVSEAVLHYRRDPERLKRWHKIVAFGRVQPLLYRRFRHAGMPRPPIGRALGEWTQLTWRLVRKILVGRPTGGDGWLAAIKLGRISGSLKNRVLYF